MPLIFGYTRLKLSCGVCLTRLSYSDVDTSTSDAKEGYKEPCELSVKVNPSMEVRNHVLKNIQKAVRINGNTEGQSTALIECMAVDNQANQSMIAQNADSPIQSLWVHPRRLLTQQKAVGASANEGCNLEYPGIREV